MILITDACIYPLGFNHSKFRLKFLRSVNILYYVLKSVMLSFVLESDYDVAEMKYITIIINIDLSIRLQLCKECFTLN